MSVRCCLLFIILIFICQSRLVKSQSQSDSLLISWAEFIEDENNLGELLEEMAENPVNINSNDRNELNRIPLINSVMVDSIIIKKSELKEYTNKRQIRNILGPELYELVKEFITIKSRSKNTFTYIHKSYYGIEKIPQIDNNLYRGDALYDYNKIQYRQSDNISFGFITQKDVGEVNYLDYMNGYIEYRNGNIKGILGSYYCHFGEGLVFANAYGQQKSSLACLPFRPGKEGGFATLSSSENTGLTGLFFTFRRIFGSDIYIFYSNSNRDAQFGENPNSVTGINYTGYHRTESELEKKDKITESLFGFAWTYSLNKSIRLGINYAAIHYNPGLKFDLTVVNENDYRRQRFKFSGSEINPMSLFYSTQFGNTYLSGEIAGSPKGSPAYTQSIFWNENYINFGIKYWYLSKNFQSPNGRFFDNSNPFPQAEEGFYFGMTVNPLKNFSINSFKILSKDLWRTYFDEMPKINDEYFIEMNYQPERISFLTRLRIKENEYFTETERKTEQQNIYRIQIDYKPEKQLLLRTRWEMTDILSTHKHGLYLFEDINFFACSSISIHTRFAFYRTDSYNSRLYEYENDLPGSYANYALYGEGRMLYLILKWKLFQRVSIWLKYRYNYIINKDLTQGVIRLDDDILQRSLRLLFKLQL